MTDRREPPPSTPVPGDAPSRPDVPGPGEDGRAFEHDGRRWIARPAGTGAAGTGAYGLGLIEAVHFYAAGDDSRPLREALLPRGRFDLLFDSELAALLEGATPIPPPGRR